MGCVLGLEVSLRQAPLNFTYGSIRLLNFLVRRYCACGASCRRLTVVRSCIMTLICCLWLDELDRSYSSHEGREIGRYRYYLWRFKATCMQARAWSRQKEEKKARLTTIIGKRLEEISLRHEGNSDVMTKCSPLLSEQAATSKVERKLISDVAKSAYCA